MKLRTPFSIAACFFIFSFLSLGCSAHEIIFCGEKIPVADRFVADKLMTTIKKQIDYGVVSQLRQKENEYMRTIEYYLMKTGLPQDLKYIAIVESGLRNVVSNAGAAGFWQFMEATARDHNLTVDGNIDERNDLNKSTHAACKLLASYYLQIRNKYKVSSWVLASAAYNIGIGKMFDAIEREGKNYFEMNLNKETADYVYKIIAVKELFEYPELYLEGFGYNIFTTTKNNQPEKKAGEKKGNENLNLGGMTVKVDESDGEHPASFNKKTKSENKTDLSKVKFVAAQITGKYKNFKDGKIVSVLLQEDLQVVNRFTGKGIVIKGPGWIIDGRVMINLGYDHYVVVLDTKKEKGIPLKSLKNKEQVLLKIISTNN